MYCGIGSPCPADEAGVRCNRDESLGDLLIVRVVGG